MIHSFAFTLLIGFIVGTYSSIYIASPVVLLMERWRRRPPDRRRALNAVDLRSGKRCSLTVSGDPATTGTGRESCGRAMLDKEDMLLNSREVAQILDLSPDTVNELARKSVLPAFKRGRQWRFRRRDITSFKRELRGSTAA